MTGTGYHWRYLDITEEAQERLAANPARLVTGYWLDFTPPPPWWIKEAHSGGQMVEQTTHIFDLARLLVGEVEEVYAVAARTERPDYPECDICESSTAVLRFAAGAVGSISSTCLLRWPHRIGLHLFCDGMAIELTEFEIMVDIGQGRPVRSSAGRSVRSRGSGLHRCCAGQTEPHPCAIRRGTEDAPARDRNCPLGARAPPDSPRSASRRHRLPVSDIRTIRSLGVQGPGRMFFYSYEEGPPSDGQFRVETLFTGFSAGTELTFVKGSNPYLNARWDEHYGLFLPGEAEHPVSGPVSRLHGGRARHAIPHASGPRSRSGRDDIRP